MKKSVYRAIGLLLLTAALGGCTLLLATRAGPHTTDRGSNATVRGSRTAIGGGSLPTFEANNETFHIDAGTFRGPLTIRGNKVTVIGAGIGETVILGGARIDGNNIRVERLSVEGPVRILGNNNDLRHAELRSGDIEAEGNNNEL